MSCALIKFLKSYYALKFLLTFYCQVVNSGCTIWSRKLLLTWKYVSCQSCSFICSFIFVIISSQVWILVLIGSFSSWFHHLFHNTKLHVFIKSISWDRKRPIFFSRFFSKSDQTDLIKQKYYILNDEQVFVVVMETKW